MNFEGPKVDLETEFKTVGYDAIIYASVLETEDPSLKPLIDVITEAIETDRAIVNEGAVLKINLPAKRLVYVPVNINQEYDDVRSFGESAKKAVLRALSAGSKCPLFVLSPHKQYDHCQLVSLLGALEALYVNLQYREDRPGVYPKVNKFGVYGRTESNAKTIVDTALILENGRFVARDIGGSDPERMTPINVEKYVKQEFKNTSISIEVIDDPKIFKEQYPLFEAVDRAASVIERHRGRIIILTYEGVTAKVDQTLFLVGKGVTYDTGGADIKAGGVMAGMSYDKCGAAAVAGFMKVLSLLKPPSIKVVSILCVVRNSVGENSYVSDEMIITRSGVRVRIGNTDAEGRTIMTDPLSYAREKALDAVNPHLITIATLTGHACLTVGNGYSIILDNGPARLDKNAEKFAKHSLEIGDPFEISTIRREDYRFHKGKVAGEDVLQAGNQPSVRTARGHQGPAAYLIMASGLDKHGIGSEKPIKYSHIDIAGSSGEMPTGATGSPVLTLFSRYLTDYFLSASG